MKNLLMIAMLAATPLAAQEFAADMPAMGEILAEARVYNVKHAGPPPAAYIGRYEPRHLRFELSIAAPAGSDESAVPNKSIRILYKESLIATLNVYDAERGIIAANGLAKALEDMRLTAMAQGRLISVDYAAIARRNETGDWSARDSKAREPLEEIIRVEQPASARVADLRVL